MQQGKIEITDVDIAYAESILIPGNTFDDERREFIRNLETIDLQAVPGSGKTTALLAKLLILEKHLPFDDGSGILVLSHTNNAIDEIKKKIEPYCPKLFSYPNHVGTIQSFVDKFLAQPCYQERRKKKITFVLDNAYIYNFNKYLEFLDPSIYKNLRFRRLTIKYDTFITSLSVAKDNETLIDIFTNKPKTIPKAGINSNTYQYVLKTKKHMINEGMMCYNDMYYIAKYCIDKYPIFLNLIRKRFKYVFVDEMQDMANHQYNILESLFRNSNYVYQRIGDLNQSIYSNSSDIDNQWENDNLVTKLTLSGTKRLSTYNKEIVNLLSVSGDKISKALDNITIKPKIIVFDDNTIGKVIKSFAELFYKEPFDINKIILNKHKIKCVGWIKDNKDELDKKGETKLSVKNYFQSFHDEANVHKNERFNLETYIRYWKDFSNQKNDFNGIRKRILDSLVFILLLEKVKNPTTNKRFYVSSLVSFLRENHEAFYENFKSQLFCWCKLIYEYKYDEALTEIRKFLPELLRALGRYISNNSYEFINEKTDKSDKIPKKQENSNNIFIYKDLEIEVSTVHAVKGETHFATLYLETFHNGHVSTLIKNRLCKIPQTKSESNLTKKALKVSYVAMSRPTHLLCFAIHRKRYEKINNHLDDWDKPPIELDKESQKE